GCLWIISHAHDAQFVNDHATILNSIWIGPIWRHSRIVSSAHGLHNFAESLLHIARHLDFVVAPLPMETKHRDSPFVNRDRVDFAIALLVRNHFAATCEADIGPIHASAFLLES